MASSKLLKERIESIQDTRKITNAMYLISSSKAAQGTQELPERPALLHPHERHHLPCRPPSAR